MKLCLACGATFDLVDWTCPACGKSPENIDGFVSFAPALAAENDGMDPEDHHRLDRAQEASFWFRARNRLIVDLFDRHFPQARSVMEVGCGSGYVLSGLKAAHPSLALTGSEIFTTGLVYARQRLGPDVALLQMDARAIPFVGSFDLICAFDVLEHIEEDATVLASMGQALRPGGGVLLSVPQHPWLWSQTDEMAFHKRRYRRGELEKKCRVAGFEILRSTSFVSTLLPVMLAQRITQGRRRGYDVHRELTPPPAINRALETVLDVERSAIGAGLSFPVGGSRFVAARKQ